MAQVTIYMNNDLETKIKNISSSLNLSISKFISNVLEEKVHNEWNSNIIKLAGSWDDFVSIDEIRDTPQDTKRGEF